MYIRDGKFKFGTSLSHVKACDGIKMIEQAYSFIRNNSSETNVQIIANNKFLMNKQMQELDGGFPIEFHKLFGNYEQLAIFSKTGGIILDSQQVKTVKEGLDKLATEIKKNPNIFGSVNFSKEILLGINTKIFSEHEYRILGYDKVAQVVKLVNPHDATQYLEVPLEIFEKANPVYLYVYRIQAPVK